MPLADAELLARLVAFESVSGRPNGPIADFICGHLADRAASVERIPSRNPERVNLALRFGPERDDRDGLVLCGHMDVVPADEPGWTGDPFRLREEGGRLYGRGTCDMKGFLALAIRIAQEARDLRAPLFLLFTCDEEVGTLGARDLAADWPGLARLPRATVVGEPTGLRVVRMHKGYVHVRIAVRGRAAHSGYPHLGHSAIEGAARVLAALRGLRHRWEQEGGTHAGNFEEVPFVPLNVGTIRGGAAANVIPDRCEMEVSFRPLPGMQTEPLLERLREAVAWSAAGEDVRVELAGESPPLLLDVEAPVHRALCDLVGQEEGGSASYATDAGWLAGAGLDCVLFGPGSIERAHKPDEFVPAEDLERARVHLEALVDRFCR